MRVKKRFWGLGTLGVSALGVLFFASTGSGQEVRSVTTEISGSVLVFPKVVWDGTRDTIIQIANTGNSLAFVHCFYVNGAPVNPNQPVGPNNPPLWSVTDFELILTRQQPTMWVASAGRRVDHTSPFAAYGSGFDPGLIPPVPVGFTGELKCVQVDESGQPWPGNRLKGEATIQRNDGDVTTYNAVALPANTGVLPGPDLELTLTESNPGGEYAACPDTTILNHFAHGTPQISLSSATSLGAVGLCAGNICPVNTLLTVVPCAQDFENGGTSTVTLQFLTFDEFEARLSGSFSVNCWLTAPLGQLSTAFTPGALGGSTTRHTRFRPVPGQGGVLMVAEESRATSVSGVTAMAAYNPYAQGNRFDGATTGEGDDPLPAPNATDVISVPVE
ncbi:MAG: hypothetical protein KatS3mg077_2726 [Candidatus Binatia bacterium]|nr:MAG: hypothetical protein KatS3mg077_2726 [Candidatus Binatia bacterium]